MKPSTLTGRDLGAALAVVVIWGVNFVAMKFALHDFTPFQLGAARYALAFFPLALVVRPPRISWKWLTLFGLFQGVGQFGFLFSALQVGMTASLASVLLQTQVFFTAFFGLVLLGERVGRPLQAGLVLAAFGLICFAMDYVGPRGIAQVTTVAGFLLTLGGASMWAMSNIIVRQVQKETPDFNGVAFMVWISMMPVLPFIALSLAFDPPESRWRWLSAPWSSWFSLAYLSWAATIFGYALWTGLLRRHSANRVAPFSLGVPVVGLATGLIVLGEPVSAWQWAGIALVVAALACVMLGGRFGAPRVPPALQETDSAADSANKA